MDRLWAPWRSQYIRDASIKPSTSSGCFLCEGLQSSDPKSVLRVWDRKHSAVFLNKYPYNNGHLLICPKPHLGRLDELDGEDLFEPIDTLKKCTVILDRILQPGGYNIGLNLGKTAGAGLPGHLHWHIVPRWDGDANFMPVIANTKVIVESLDEFYLRFQAEILD